MAKKHLSYSEFKSIYGDLGVTKWVKYNWSNAGVSYNHSYFKNYDTGPLILLNNFTGYLVAHKIKELEGQGYWVIVVRNQDGTSHYIGNGNYESGLGWDTPIWIVNGQVEVRTLSSLIPDFIFNITLYEMPFEIPSDYLAIPLKGKQVGRITSQPYPFYNVGLPASIYTPTEGNLPDCIFTENYKKVLATPNISSFGYTQQDKSYTISANKNLVIQDSDILSASDMSTKLRYNYIFVKRE